MELTLPEVRATLLAAQGLLAPVEQPAEKVDVIAAIRRMAALQIDAINVVARSQYLVLWSRLGRYEPRWLDELLAEGALFEYWSHAACFVPIEDFPLYRHAMLRGSALPYPSRWAHAWIAANPEVVGRVLAHIREHGEVRTGAFERTDGQAGGWWNWKPEKAALESLHTTGELMIARRENFQRVYNLRERLLPDWDDARALGADAARRALVLRAVRSLGVAAARWVPPYFKLGKRGIAALLEELVASGELTRARVADWPEPVYLDPAGVAHLNAIRAGAARPARTTLLSPFDPVIRDRERALELYGFAYRIEVYTPAAKRRYGYFTLPILHRDTLVGRLDPKVERKAGRLVIRAAHLEPGVPLDESLVGGLAAALRDLAAFLGVPGGSRGALRPTGFGPGAPRPAGSVAPSHQLAFQTGRLEPEHPVRMTKVPVRIGYSRRRVGALSWCHERANPLRRARWLPGDRRAGDRRLPCLPRRLPQLRQRWSIRGNALAQPAARPRVDCGVVLRPLRLRHLPPFRASRARRHHDSDSRRIPVAAILAHRTGLLRRLCTGLHRRTSVLMQRRRAPGLPACLRSLPTLRHAQFRLVIEQRDGLLRRASNPRPAPLPDRSRVAAIGVRASKSLLRQLAASSW